MEKGEEWIAHPEAQSLLEMDNHDTKKRNLTFASLHCRKGLFFFGLYLAFLVLAGFYQALATKGKALAGGEIPNRVHFVRQVDRSEKGEKKEIYFEFKHFMAVYSAHLWLKPEEIFIWTDATEADLHAVKTSSNPFTRAVANLPTVNFHSREMPTMTTKGVPITRYAHRSDFIRSEVMLQYGGVYLDDDSWILKDLTALRRSGYDNVFGVQYGGEICQAIWLSRPHNPFLQAWVDLQHQEFNGEWTRAGNQLVSQLYLDFFKTVSNRHALVLEREAFFPGDWRSEQLQMLYALHNNTDQIPSPEHQSLDVKKVVSNYRNGQLYNEWRRDWGASYNIHGWSHQIKKDNAWGLFGNYTHLSFDYVLSRQSNVARALYPALRKAIDTGALRL